MLWVCLGFINVLVEQTPSAPHCAWTPRSNTEGSACAIPLSEDHRSQGRFVHQTWLSNLKHNVIGTRTARSVISDRGIDDLACRVYGLDLPVPPALAVGLAVRNAVPRRVSSWCSTIVHYAPACLSVPCVPGNDGRSSRDYGQARRQPARGTHWRKD